MELTVYHATSSMFIRSIQEQGLVAVKIRERLPSLSTAMKEMIEILDKKYSKYGTDWGELPGFSSNCKRMADNNYKNESGMDYEYGNLYVTSSLFKISVYADYEFGSELITYFYRLYKRLFLELKDKSKDGFDSKYGKLVDIVNINSANRKNIILRAHVDTADMLCDTGEAVDLEYIQICLEAGGLEESFRMKRTIQPDELEVLTIENKELKSHGMLSTFEIPEKWIQI